MMLSQIGHPPVTEIPQKAYTYSKKVFYFTNLICYWELVYDFYINEY